jgi:squalene-hopene/tetraprenyl-beta-curcumene cyclase
MLNWMEKMKTSDDNNGWVPLWFGDQDAEDEKAPVYGTATAIDYLMSSHHPKAMHLAQSQVDFILRTQNEDGGWGGNKGVKSKVTYTSRALAALAHFPDQYETEKHRGWDYLYLRFKAGTLYDREPIGLYFSRLWYSEELYNILFLLNAIKRMTE